MIAFPEDHSRRARPPLRVLHLLAPAPFGGLEQVVRSLASLQRDDARIADVRVATLGEAPEPFARALREASVEVSPIVTPARAYGAQRRALGALCRLHRPDLVHVHGAHADVIGSRSAITTNAAMVSTAHGQVGGDLRNRFYEWLQRRAFARRDAVVAVSRPLALSLIADGTPPERIHVVRNAWRADAAPRPRREARVLLGLPFQGFVVGWIGRITHEKGLDLLIDALATAPMPDLRLAIIGEGSERGALSARAGRTALGRNQRIHWLGGVPDAARTVHAFDVLVISSRTEGTPLVLLEAMAAGIPVVTTAVGGIPDVIDETEGFLVPPGDTGALRAAIDRVQRDPTEARRRARAAAQRLAVESDVERWVDRYAMVYDAALTARRVGTTSRATSAP